MLRSISRVQLLKSPLSSCVGQHSLNPHITYIPAVAASHNLHTTRMASSKHSMANRLKGTNKNVWVEFGKLATDHKALNMGQGFPDFMPPKHIRDAMQACVTSENPFMHQYTRSFGHPRLINVMSKLYSPLLNHDIDPMKEILLTLGGYGSLFCSVQGLINPGDEVIIIEPYFDCYEPMVNVAGGIPVFVPLRPSKSSGATQSSADWKLDPDELASKFNSKTKAIFFNNPNNPLGKVFQRDEMEMVAELCRKWDVVCLSDEVYEWLVYSGNQHIRMATLPGMWERTITIGSAGKTFSATGWKLGWSIGPEHLLRSLQTVHQNCIYTCPTPIQEAVAVGFETELARLGQKDCYFNELPAELEPKRERVAALLTRLNMQPIMPEGGYFMMADFSTMDVKIEDDSDNTKDIKFVTWMTKNKKLAAIPPSAFYSKEHKHLGEKYIRFCFIKEDSTIDKLEELVNKWAAELGTV